LFVRQLGADETLVAVVDILRVLELLYLVNADVDVVALDVVLIELRQLLEAIELALEARGRPLRVLLGETARGDRRSEYTHCSTMAGELTDVELSCGFRLYTLFLTRRPLPQVAELSSARGVGPAAALRLMIRFVTLVAVVVMPFDTGGSVGEEASSEGLRSAVDAVFLPNPSLHFDGFLVTGVGAGTGGTADKASKLEPRVDVLDEAMLISRAKACEASASVAKVWSVGEVGEIGDVADPLPLRAPRFRRLVVDVDRDSVSNS
jgi:hypothetical protein